MSILITGAEGFVGRNLVESFLGKKYSVLFPSQDELDLTNAEDVGKYFKSNTIESVIHCATTMKDGTSYPANTCENNLRMFFNLQRHVTSSMKLLNLGSGGEYGIKHWRKKMPEEYFDENVPGDDHCYAKYLVSKYINDMNSEDLTCLRIFGIFGKYEDYRYKFISNVIAKNLLKMPVVINQNVVYDYIYITDFIRIVEYFLNNKTSNRIYNITPTESIDLLSIVSIVNKVSEYKSDIQVLNSGVGTEYTGDNKKLLSEIGEFRFTPYTEAITELYGYYKERINDLDADAIKQDKYLDYAKKINDKYFSKENEK